MFSMSDRSKYGKSAFGLTPLAMAFLSFSDAVCVIYCLIIFYGISVQVRNDLEKVTINNYRSIIYGVYICYFLFYCFLAVDNLFFTVH